MFLSYSRQDDDQYLQTFVTSLRMFLASRFKIEPAETIFQDVQGIQPAERWKGILGRSVADAQAFVAILTDDYLRSEMCAREWHAFNARLTAVRPAPPLLLPIVWRPCRRLPAGVGDLQLTHPSLGELYGKGLRYVAQKHPDEYAATVARLADRLEAILLGPRLPRPAEPLDLDEYPGTFEIHRPRLRWLAWIAVLLVAALGAVGIMRKLTGRQISQPKVAVGGAPAGVTDSGPGAPPAPAPNPGAGSSPPPRVALDASIPVAVRKNLRRSFAHTPKGCKSLSLRVVNFGVEEIRGTCNCENGRPVDATLCMRIATQDWQIAPA